MWGFFTRTAWFFFLPTTEQQANTQKTAMATTWSTKDQSDAAAVARKYAASNRMVIIIHTDKGMALLRKKKYITPSEITGAQLMAVVRRHCTLGPSSAIFLMCKDTATMIKMQETVGACCHEHADRDGILHLVCVEESVFG